MINVLLISTIKDGFTVVTLKFLVVWVSLLAMRLEGVPVFTRKFTAFHRAQMDPFVKR